LPESLTRPKRVRLRYDSRFRLTRLRQIGLPHPTLDRLLVKRTIYKVNSFQFTRLTRLCLAHQDLQDEYDILFSPFRVLASWAYALEGRKAKSLYVLEIRL
ncbi:hypothetical protein ACFL0M_12470, partial [Thermodesulfobacteriota bacterium]